MQTESELASNVEVEFGGRPRPVTLSPTAYCELVFAARQFDAMRSGPGSRGATVKLIPQRDGAVRIEAA